MGPTQAKARYVMPDPKKDACESTDNKRGSTKRSREAETRQAAEEYVIYLREIVEQLRRKFFD